MNKIVLAGAFMVLAATASAAETGIINQAGPYEATLRLYLHPAHGFPGKAEPAPQGATAADADSKGKPRAQASPEPGPRLQAALHAPSDRGDNSATREPR